MPEPRRFLDGERLIGPTPCARCGQTIHNGQRIQVARLSDGSGYVAHRPACAVGTDPVIDLADLEACRREPFFRLDAHEE